MVDFTHILNTLSLKQNGQNLADDIFKYIFVNENCSILIKISFKFVPEGPIISALFQIMAWHWSGDKPLYESKMA